MDWGDTPAWVAIAFSAGALVVSVLARKDSKRSSDIAAEALALQQREADERRAASVPKAHLVLEHVPKHLYRLRNVGEAPAVNVCFELEELSAVAELPEEPMTMGLARRSSSSWPETWTAACQRSFA